MLVPVDIYSYGIYAVVIVLSCFCGSVTFAVWYLKNADQPNKFVKWFVDAGQAAISGFSMYCLCQAFGIEIFKTLFCVCSAAAGWSVGLESIRFLRGLPVRPDSRGPQ